MSKLGERIEQELAELRRYSHRNTTRLFTANLENDSDVRCQNFIGGLVCEFLPDLTNRQLHESEYDNRNEFRSLINLLSWISENKKFIEQQMQNYEAPPEAGY